MKRAFKDMVTYEPYDYLNSEITGDYDKAHAVKCTNGIFVGTEEHGITESVLTVRTDRGIAYRSWSPRTASI